MKNTRIKLFAVVISAVTMMLAIISLYTLGATAVTTVSIPDCTVPPGNSIVAPIIIHNVTNVMTADVNLSFDPSVVQVLSADNSDFDMMIPTIDNTNGWIRIGALQMGSGALSGNITIANLTLQAVGSAGSVSPLDFTNIYLENGTGIEIPAIADNGTFTVEDIIPPQIENVTSDPPTQVQNGYVNITCDVTDNVAVDEVWANITYPDSS